MTTLRVLRPVAPADVVVVGRLHEAAEAADGHASLNDAVWRDLEHPGADSAGVLAVDGERAVAYAHAARGDNLASPHWDVGIVVHPDARHERGIEADVLAAVADHVAGHGGGLAVLWMLGADDRSDGAVAAAGFVPQRELLQMRMPLPPAEHPAWPAGTEVRAFVPGADDEAWLAVNNRAFAGHPEQGGWTKETLRRRMAEPWFDPAGFVLAFDDDGLAGFCWTKVQPAGPGRPDPLGEIFVIGVDPARHSRGLGRALVLAGLASLAQRGVATGMLFVDGANTAAVGLYESLGFTTLRRDRAYAREVAAA
ncbi:MAG TPA: mycothiol synthase [Acidimicrobiia bacterium]